jgi:CRP-like cAMP-binding protein
MRQVFNSAPWIPPSEIADIKQLFYTYGTAKKVTKNSVIKSGGQHNRLFLLEKGLCMYLVNYSIGKTRVLALIPPGRSLCNISCISGERVNVTTLAKRNTDLISMSPAILLEQITKRQDLAVRYMKFIIATQESLLEGMIANFTLSHEDRLKVFFKSLLHSFALENKIGMVEIPIPLFNEELGMIINATRVTVSRIKKKWSHQGLYQKKDRKAYINTSLLADVYDWHR